MNGQREGQSKRTKSQKRPGWLFLVLAVIYPLAVIAVELYTNMCAEAFFDPMPTLYHKILVFLVPFSNYLLWWKLRSDDDENVGKLLLLSAVSIGVAAYYAAIFLPLMPIGIIALVFYGIGLLPLAPIVSLVMASRLYYRLKTKHDDQVGKKSYLFKGISTAIFALLLLDIPSAATYFGVGWATSNSGETRESGIKLIRSFGDKDLLLRLCYQGSRQATGLLSFAAIRFSEHSSISPAKARELFYQVTGETFNMYPVPYSGRSWSRFDGFSFDADQGGTEVGGRVKGLDLVLSRLDGSIDSDDGVAYLEWVLEFRNSSFSQQEARLQIALPQEGVVSRATLWVNGEESEAAFAGRAKARQAYQSVVRVRRDPLLVTTSGVDRILVQAFPIPPNGGTIKFRIGITAPMELRGLDRASVVLPAIVDRNFSIGEEVKHAVWIEGKHPFKTDLFDVESRLVTPQLFRLNGSISDKGLAVTRKLLTSQRDASVTQSISRFGENEVVVQNVVNEEPVSSDALFVVVDGSNKVGPHIEAIINALGRIPAGKRVGLIVADGEGASVEIAEWSGSQKSKIEAVLRGTEFVGGQDNAPALTSAIKLLEQYESAELLWIHSPQPIRFEGTRSLLEQGLYRLTRLPKISLYSLQPGPNKLLNDAKWALTSRTIPRLGRVEEDLGGFFESLYSTSSRPVFQRTVEGSSLMAVTGSQHIARLWARDQVRSLLENNDMKNAISLAANYQLVTAVSGAVVLENQQQYNENDLTPVDKNTVPTIPEPHQWVLAFFVVVVMLWFLRQNKYLLISRA
ncbi:MAG: VIT domain-containing protein [Candidatus Thiodiazotropha sp.]|jgi:hypothetical protein